MKLDEVIKCAKEGVDLYTCRGGRPAFFDIDYVRLGVPVGQWEAVAARGSDTILIDFLFTLEGAVEEAQLHRLERGKA